MAGATKTKAESKGVESDPFKDVAPEDLPLEKAKADVEALTEAAMTLHDVRDDLQERVEKLALDDASLQPLQSAVIGIEDGIRSLDGAIRKSARLAAEYEEAKAIGAGTSKGTPSEVRGGRPISREITEAAAADRGASHVPGTIASGYPPALTPEEVKEQGLEGALSA